MQFKIEVQCRWGPARIKTADITPARGHPVLLAWEIDPPPVDAAVPAEPARVIAAALTDP